MNITTPEWVRHAIFYQIFPDRFAKSARVEKPANLEPWDSKPTVHGFKGGDLRGIVDHFDYLRDLGINAIYLNPVFQSASNHRYHTHDYFKIDPILGGDEAFDHLIKQAHKRDIRVVIDGVFNHASRGFYQFNHALENGAGSPYLDWFHIHGFPLHAYEGTPKYDSWWGIPDLPKFNTGTPAVREYLMRVAEYWIERGIDGWRLDVPAEINDDSFWQEFRRRVKAKNPDAYVVGEIWHEAQRWLAGDQFDAVMNYVYTRAAIGFFTHGKFDHHLTADAGYAPVTKLNAQDFAYSINIMLGLYARAVNEVQLNLIDSHDTPRYLTVAKGDVNALRLSMLCMMTLPGAPSIYYGDEIGMLGGRDPDCRRSFNWDEATWNTELRDAIKAMIKLRKKHRALRDGEFKVLFAEGMTVAYARRRDDEHAVVVLNAGDHPAEIVIHTNGEIPDNMTLKSVLGHRASAQASGGVLSAISVPARDGMVLMHHA